MSILILFSHLHLDMPGGLFLSRFPTIILYTPLLSPMRVTCPAHLILLYLITRNIFSNTLILHCSLSCSLNVSDQVSRPYKNDRQNYSSVYLNLYISR